MKDIRGFEGEYAVSDDGKVWSHKTKSLLSLRGSGVPGKARRKRGYQTVALWKQGRGYVYLYVHRLVAEAFVPNPNGYKVVNHKDGNKSNNWADNLEWCTTKQNLRHAFLNGLTTRGARNSQTVLKEDEVRTIKRLLKEGKLFQREIGAQYGVSQSNISMIARGKNWSWLDA